MLLHWLPFVYFVDWYSGDMSTEALIIQRSHLEKLHFCGRFVHRQINEGVGALFPRRVQQTLLESIFALGRMQVAPYILNAYNPFGSFRLQKLKRMLDEGQSLQLQFPAEDLGFRFVLLQYLIWRVCLMIKKVLLAKKTGFNCSKHSWHWTVSNIVHGWTVDLYTWCLQCTNGCLHLLYLFSFKHVLLLQKWHFVQRS